jgi:hypothetical protein
MSEIIFDKYSADITYQHRQNEARHIQTKVSEARKNPTTSGPRWPFELLQNALDAGTRPDRETIAVVFHYLPGKLIFEHDGAPFTTGDLAALLSGGSNKPFDSKKTTGRFGTGFLVTHVLAEKTKFEGIVQAGEVHERFTLTLDRSGDEKTILANMDACDTAIKAARPIQDITSTMSARFEYDLETTDAMHSGINRFQDALPYIYGTRPRLGVVKYASAQGANEEWTPTTNETRTYKSGFVSERLITLKRTPAQPDRAFRIVRVTTQAESESAALTVLEKTTNGWTVQIPSTPAPRMYREYPIKDSTFLPVNFVLDGKFSVDQERTKIQMGEAANRKLIQEALDAAIMTIELANDENWANRHLLAMADEPTTVFEGNNAEERKWWKDELARFATAAAKLPLVQTEAERLPALASDGRIAVFPLPMSTRTSPKDETTLERVLALTKETEGLNPPLLEVAKDWSTITTGWKKLGVPLKQVAVKDLAEAARRGVGTIAGLHVLTDKTEWLARFIDVTGECWIHRNGVDTSLLEGLVPNQDGSLCSPDKLLRDHGISEELKDIATGMGHNVREKLLAITFTGLAKTLDLKYLEVTLTRAVPNMRSCDEILEECLKVLHERVPEGSAPPGKYTALLDGSVRLLDYLWRSKNLDGASTARRVPFLSVRGAIVRWGPDRIFMAPVCKWNTDAQPFHTIYPENRVLVEMYAGVPDRSLPDVTTPLVEWGICHADPLSKDKPAELQEMRLTALGEKGVDVSGTVVTGQQFTQIALLHPEVFIKCVADDGETAKALLGLVLCYIVRQDNSWKTQSKVKGRKAKVDVEVNLHGALWLADLTYRSWVPVKGEDGKMSNKVVPTGKILSEMLDPAWLTNNTEAIDLLTTVFGVDALELRLLGMAPVPADRERLRNGIAMLVEKAGGNPETYAQLAQQVEDTEKRTRDVERCRKFGLAVQDAVCAALTAKGLKLKFIDCGYDFKVENPAEYADGDPSFRFGLGTYLLEVKATTSGKPRLTPTQAETASKERARYILCVVDLRNVPSERLDAPWQAEDVEPLARLKTNIGDKVNETWALVDKARTGQVSIRNEATLRYEVPAEIWASGTSIASWVETISHQTTPETAPAALPESHA